VREAAALTPLADNQLIADTGLEVWLEANQLYERI
jgi:hypothetical protein